jgi:phenylpyruvate tautomerase PptA (4-oxalocrotonate tautomerase family)
VTGARYRARATALRLKPTPIESILPSTPRPLNLLHPMPTVTLEARRGVPPQLKRQLLDAVHDALVSAFKIPDHDRTQRFVEHDAADFDIPPGRGERYTLVTISAFAGRSLDAKRALYRTIVERFEAHGVPRTDVMILLHEEPRENWGLRGGVAGTDIDLGFEIKV